MEPTLLFSKFVSKQRIRKDRFNVRYDRIPVKNVGFNGREILTIEPDMARRAKRKSALLEGRSL